MAWICVNEFDRSHGWASTPDPEERMRWHCRQLEEGQVLFFDHIPFDLPHADQEFLLSQRQSGSRFHKNVSYRPQQDALRGFDADRSEDVRRLHAIMRNYSAQVTQFVSRFLAPYAGHWSMDFASFRPLEEAGRDLPLHKRNDLLHVDAFPTRPTRGGRILRVFTNINPSRPRVWETGERFDVLAQRFAVDAGLEQIVRRATSPSRVWLRRMGQLGRVVGLSKSDHSPYDLFMLRFHDYLKANSDFQQNCAKTRLEFPPRSTWLAFLDGVPHAALSGQFALEQTYIIPVSAMVAPHLSPIRVLEAICGRTLSN